MLLLEANEMVYVTLLESSKISSDSVLAAMMSQKLKHGTELGTVYLIGIYSKSIKCKDTGRASYNEHVGMEGPNGSA